MNEYALELEDASYTRFGHCKFRDVTLQVPKKSVVSFVGRTGSCKAQVLDFVRRSKHNSLISRFTGRFALEGREQIVKNRLRSLRPGALPVVSKNQAILPGTIEDNLHWAKSIAFKAGSISSRERDELLESVLLKPEHSSRKVKTLSLVERRKLIAARAAALEPSAIIFGDMTSDLDPIERSEIEEVVLSLARNQQIIIDSHDLRFVGRVSDKVAVFDASNLAEFGDSYQIFHNPRHERTKELLGDNN